VSRFPAAAFAALVAATVGAFFVTQHLKVSTPLIAGFPSPQPAAISPRQTGCGGKDRRTMVSFYLLHRADDVDVYVIDSSGAIVATLASGRHMRIKVRKPDGVFYWDGREDGGSLAPDGTYYIRVALIHQGRTAEVSSAAGVPLPIAVKTVPPRPLVTRVDVAGEGMVPALIPQHGKPAQIHYRGNEQRGGTVRIYRTDLPGAPRLVKSYPTPWKGSTAIWNGLIDGRPAPAGTYLMGLDVTDNACNTGHFPARIPPAPGSTPHAGVTVRYLAAQPPLDPIAAGSRAIVYVDSRGRSYGWTLTRAGARAPVSRGAGRGYQLHVTVPGRGAGLYELALRSGTRRTAVPLVVHATAPPRAARAAAPAHASPKPPRVLVVLPALTWQGLNPVDDDGDGIPNTLDAGGPIRLARPLAGGLPAGFPDEAALLAYLDKSHHPYDLSTDLALIDGSGPAIAGHSGVVLAGSERWLPSSLGSALRTYIQGGGKLLSLGIDSLRRGVKVGQSGPGGAEALQPTPPGSPDALGARPAALVPHSTELITESRDGLGIFSGTAGTFPGFHSYQPIPSVAPPAQIASAAGVSDMQPSIIGYQLGRGIVVEVGLPGLGSSLAQNVNSQELVDRLWTVLSG